ncbi:MAG: hypothetical protein E7642_05250 [Ruminococcaceae bacterium]|nr:hypothetical protein [Oscillospiraceae bacterium]
MTDISTTELFSEDLSSSEKDISEDAAVAAEINIEANSNAEATSNDDEDTAPPDSSSEDSCENSDEAEKTVGELREEIAALKQQLVKLEKLKENQDRILNELSDFAYLFPEVAVDEIPEEVWEAVKKGTALSASYALYEKRKAAEAIRAAKINEKNASMSPGAAGTNTAGEYFSPEEVRRMSREEVHANYSKIKESMKKWMQR